MFADGTRLSASGHIPAAFALLLPPKGARAHAKFRAKAAIEVRYVSKAAVERNVEHTRRVLNSAARRRDAAASGSRTDAASAPPRPQMSAESDMDSAAPLLPCAPASAPRPDIRRSCAPPASRAPRRSAAFHGYRAIVGELQRVHRQPHAQFFPREVFCRHCS